MDEFRKQLPVIEIISSNRLRKRHWEQMSEIVGIDLTIYEDATISQFCCDLDLKQHVTKLKPITFMAEREGVIIIFLNIFV